MNSPIVEILTHHTYHNISQVYIDTHIPCCFNGRDVAILVVATTISIVVMLLQLVLLLMLMMVMIMLLLTLFPMLM